ncbi:hypothetical protein [Streptomyces marianii]|uniref:hypothetical protein n=1 Tax=Streptomyces marianii TaxID=1817406 RepID=UPI0026C39FF6
MTGKPSCPVRREAARNRTRPTADPTAWLSGCHRLHRRYERKADHFLAFTSIACTLICYRRLGGATPR